MLGATSPTNVPTRHGALHVEVADGGARQLVAITPIGAAWLVRALPAGLLDHFTIHVVELPGTGRSGSTGAAVSVRTQVEAIADVAELLATPVFLFGHSMNGLLVMAAASTTGAQAVIAVCAPPSLPPARGADAYWAEKAEPERRERAARIEAAISAASSGEERRRLHGEHDRLRRWFDLSFDSTELDALGVLTPGWVEGVFASGADVAWDEVTTTVSCPVLLALGEYDFVVPPTAWAPDLLPPRATVRTFPRSGHTPFVEEPEAFEAAVAGWLETVR